MGKIIVHIDLNAFFVRCEELKNPSLIGKPVAIGHDGRKGIVSTCSYKAREFGVKSGMPMFKAKELCPDLIIKPVDFRFYGVLSQEFFKFVREYSNLVENASVDECYADFTDVLKGNKNPIAFFESFQRKLFEKTGLYCSIGVAPTKFLAKMGSDLKKPNGITIIRKRDIDKIIFPLPIKDMFGIGAKTQPRLISIGVNTIGELYEGINSNNENVLNILGKFVHTAKDWLEGKGDNEISLEADDPKSIGNSTTLPSDTNDYDEIKYYLTLLSKEVSRRAMEESKVGNTIQIVVKEPAPSFKSYNKSITFSNPTNDFNIILDKSLKLYENNFLGKTFRLVGVTLQNLISKRDMTIQMTLFDYEDHEKDCSTVLLINELNRRLKKPALIRASDLESEKK